MEKETIDLILQPVSDEENARRERRLQSGFWKAVRRVAGNTPFLADLLAAYYCVMDQQTPTRVRAILLAALAYFILPVDTIPDFLAFFGFTDDIAVLTAAIAAVSGSITDAHKRAAQKTLQEFAAETD